MTTSNRIRILALLAVAVLGLFLLDRLVLTPLLGRWQEREDEIVALRGRLTRGAQLVDQETRWQRQREEMRARRLPAATEDAQNLLLGRIDGWARESGLRLTAMRPRWRHAKDERATLEIQVTADGAMRQIVDFVNAIETAPLAVAVDQLAVTAGRQTNGNLGVELRLSALCREEER